MLVDLERVLQAAAKIADARGLRALTIARLAKSLRIQPPSLYNHIRGLDALLDALTHRGLQMLLDRSRDAVAGVSGADALYAIANAQRQFAQEHPGLFQAIQLPVAHQSKASHALGESYVALAVAVLRGYGLTGDPALHALRVLRSTVKGFIDLELGGGFGLPLDLDVSFQVLLSIMDAGIRSMSHNG